jgi:hypothetical protein
MTTNKDSEIDEVEVWDKFSATHRYKRDRTGVMRLVSSRYFQVDPFGIEPLRPVSKQELIALLESEPILPNDVEL